MIITVSSMKGGVGKTETALNLSIALKKAGKRVCLVDFDIPYGGVAQALGDTKEISVTDWLNTNRSISTKALKSLIAVHEKSGLNYIPAISSVHDANKLTDELVRKIFNQLKEIYEYIIVDSGVDFGRLTAEALKLSDKIVIVTTPSNVSAQNNYRYKEDLALLGIGNDKLMLFINMIHEKRAADVILEKIVGIFKDSGVPVETAAAAYFDERIMHIRDANGFIYTQKAGGNFKKGIDNILKKIGAYEPDFKEVEDTTRIGFWTKLKGLFIG